MWQQGQAFKLKAKGGRSAAMFSRFLPLSDLKLAATGFNHGAP